MKSGCVRLGGWNERDTKPKALQRQVVSWGLASAEGEDPRVAWTHYCGLEHVGTAATYREVPWKAFWSGELRGESEPDSRA